MTLNAGGPGYGSLSSPGFSHSGGGTEAVPLLIPADDSEVPPHWRPLSREQLQVAAGSPGWKKFRFYLVLLFWLTWFAMLSTAIGILVMTPKPVVQPLKWWQKSLFYQVQLDLGLDQDATVEESAGLNALPEEFSNLRSLGVGAVILEGLFETEVASVNITAPTKGSSELIEILYVLQEGNKADLKVVLDFCGVDLLQLQDGGLHGVKFNTSAIVKDILSFWMSHGVAGFTICDTDEAYSEKTLLEWRQVLKEFNTEDERILLVKQKGETLLPLDTSHFNSTLMDVVIKPILPSSPLPLSGREVSTAIETHLYQAERDGVWNSWMVGGKTSEKLKKLLLVLLMTLPGSPAVEHDPDIDQKDTVALNLAAAFGENGKVNSPKRSMTHALFRSLSQHRAREETLLYGTFTFLPCHGSNTSSNSSLLQPPPVLAFLRSWGCVHFLILLNTGAETHSLDPGWAPSLPEAGVYVASTGMDRLGTTSLNTIQLQQHEAIVIKLFEAGAYS